MPYYGGFKRKFEIGTHNLKWDLKGWKDYTIFALWCIGFILAIIFIITEISN